MTLTQKIVLVDAPARLHMGFIDLSGALGRQFGSIGLALNEISTRLRLSSSAQPHVTGQRNERVYACLQRLCRALNVSDNVCVDIESSIPEHVGLGSGTQLALALGSALNTYYELGLSVRQIAGAADRGLRSGIGIGVFEKGGLVVDGGRGRTTQTPPLIAHLQIPENWRFILVFDQRGQGLHGQLELDAFKKLPPFSQQEAARLSYLLLMQGLPAVAERDLIGFGQVITELQQALGRHFASVQGGVFTSEQVATAMQWLQQQGAVAIGQTSWGPTGFCAVDSHQQACDLIKRLDAMRDRYRHLTFMITSARNTRAEVVVS